MTSIELNSHGQIELIVDLSIYNDSIIDKVMYWWSGEYVITRKNIPATTLQTITLTANSPISQDKFDEIRHKLSADFVDYKNRVIIEAETADLRKILYAKAFANSDDFVEFEFKE